MRRASGHRAIRALERHNKGVPKIVPRPSPRSLLWRERVVKTLVGCRGCSGWRQCPLSWIQARLLFRPHTRSTSFTHLVIMCWSIRAAICFCGSWPQTEKLCGAHNPPSVTRHHVVTPVCAPPVFDPKKLERFARKPAERTTVVRTVASDCWRLCAQ